MNNLKAAILALSSALRPFYERIEQITPKERNTDRSKKQKTKRGATHKSGSVFLSRQVSPVSPARYRRLHLGNPEKAQRELAKASKKNES